MNLGEVKQLLYETIVAYHPGALVVWEKTKGAAPMPPYITIGYSNLERSLFLMSDDEGEHQYYNYSCIFEINLYTAGKKVIVNENDISIYENTAVEDLEEFVRFLNSEAITDGLSQKGLNIIFNSPIRDLSELIGNTKFNYRAMAEFTVTFVGTADGMYGVLKDKTGQNSSGGGAKKFWETPIDSIEEVDIQYDKEEE